MGTVQMWNFGLLFGTFIVLFGLSAFVTARRSQQRHLSYGMILQGILISFVVAASVYDQSVGLKVAEIAVLGLLFAHSIWNPERFDALRPADLNEPTDAVP